MFGFGADGSLDASPPSCCRHEGSRHSWSTLVIRAHQVTRRRDEVLPPQGRDRKAELLAHLADTQNLTLLCLI